MKLYFVDVDFDLLLAWLDLLFLNTFFLSLLARSVFVSSSPSPQNGKNQKSTCARKLCAAISEGISIHQLLIQTTVSDLNFPCSGTLCFCSLIRGVHRCGSL